MIDHRAYRPPLLWSSVIFQAQLPAVETVTPVKIVLHYVFNNSVTFCVRMTCQSWMLKIFSTTKIDRILMWFILNNLGNWIPLNEVHLLNFMSLDLLLFFLPSFSDVVLCGVHNYKVGCFHLFSSLIFSCCSVWSPQL